MVIVFQLLQVDEMQLNLLKEYYCSNIYFPVMDILILYNYVTYRITFIVDRWGRYHLSLHFADKIFKSIFLNAYLLYLGLNFIQDCGQGSNHQ